MEPINKLNLMDLEILNKQKNISIKIILKYVESKSDKVVFPFIKIHLQEILHFS